MLTAVRASRLVYLGWGERVDPRESYRCPGCHGAVIPRQGGKRIPHFAHRPGTEHQGCRDDRDEGMKLAALGYFPGIDRDIEVRDLVAGQRPDVVVDGALVIECQAARLDFAEWARRTAGYNAAGFAPIVDLGHQSGQTGRTAAL